MLVKSIERNAEKKTSRSIFAFFAKNVIVRSLKWRRDILRSSLNAWLLLRAHLTNRHRLLEVSIASSITCLKWRVLTLWMILCFLSLIFTYFSQFALIRLLDQIRRFLRVFLMIAEHSSFQNDLTYSLERAQETTASMTLSKKNWMTAICRSISTTNRKWIERDAWSFFCLILSQFIDFHALLEEIMFVSLFRVKLIRIEMWSDDWLRFDLMLQWITRFARNSIMKIRSIVLCTLRASQIIVSIERIKKRSRFSVKFNS
jgi:hypothetical protein